MMNWKGKLAALGLALAASTGMAHAEGVLNIFNWGNYTSPEMIKKFEDTYKVKVSITDYDSNDTALAKIRQGGHGFDIAMPSQNYIPIWIEEGLVQEIDATQMENGKNIAEEWKNPPFDPGRKYSVPWALGTVGVVVNTDAYKGPADSWAAVFDPPEELKGKINIVPEMNDVIYAATKYHGGKICESDKDVLRKVRDTLLKAKPYWVAMEYSTIEKMVAGDFKASSDWNGSALRQRLRNPAIHYFYPKEGVLVWSDNIVLLKDAKNVENAKLFMNFMMDPENAAMNSAFHRYANGIAGSEAFMPADMKDAPEINVPADVMAKSDFSVACPQEVQELYTRIWTEVQK
jgi:spermidine/putrescine transport system substrate-binding protein